MLLSLSLFLLYVSLNPGQLAEPEITKACRVAAVRYDGRFISSTAASYCEQWSLSFLFGKNRKLLAEQTAQLQCERIARNQICPTHCKKSKGSHSRAPWISSTHAQRILDIALPRFCSPVKGLRHWLPYCTGAPRHMESEIKWKGTRESGDTLSNYLFLLGLPHVK